MTPHIERQHLSAASRAPACFILNEQCKLLVEFLCLRNTRTKPDISVFTWTVSKKCSNVVSSDTLFFKLNFILSVSQFYPNTDSFMCKFTKIVLSWHLSYYLCCEPIFVSFKIWTVNTAAEQSLPCCLAYDF